MTRKLSSGIEDRLDAVTYADAESRAAVDALWAILDGVERKDGDLFQKLSGAVSDAQHAVQRAAWLDGWACGRDPDRLVYAALQHPDTGRAV